MQMRQMIDILVLETPGEGFSDITAALGRWLQDASARDGLLTLLLRHTSASLTIQENADPDVVADLTDALRGLAPRNAGYRHTLEGPDDMPAHIRTMLTGVNLQIPVKDGRMMLGTWQGIYVIEHRARTHRREIALHFFGETGG